MIEVQGKKFRFNMYAMERMADKETLKPTAYDALYKMVYAGLHGEAYVNETEPIETWGDIVEYVESLTDEELAAISQEMQNSSVYKRLVPETKTDAKKKPPAPKRQPVRK